MMTVSLDQRVYLGEGWHEALAQELREPYMEELAAFIREERRSGVPIYPPATLVFNAFRQTPLDSVKVVIMGQDPYHNRGQAHGLCFSVQKGVRTPPSLQNIFKELMDDVGIPQPPHGDLTCWAKQGVLLLNATLTVRERQAGSHQGKGWERFTDAAIRALLGREVIFVLWGRFAREKVRHVVESEPGSHPRILTCPHPSPLSAHNGFFGCKHFSQVNKLLREMGKESIDWTVR